MASDSPLSSIQLTILDQTHHELTPLTNHLRAAGFVNTGDGDTTRCVECDLEISGWTKDMVPFTIHAQRSPRCPFVNALQTADRVPSTVVPNTIGSTLVLRETIPVNESATSTNSNSSWNNFVESEQLKQARQRSFSHWPNRTRPSAKQMIDAGLFCCNKGDRVICIYCNLICQRWETDTYDPYVVHKKLSPDCSYVRAFLTSCGPPTIINDNSRLTISLAGIPPLVSNSLNSLVENGVIRPTGQNNSSQTDRTESIDDAIQANYFNTDVITNGVCPHCGEAFRNLDEDEIPMMDHAHQYPDCPYVQQLQGVAIYRAPQSTLIKDQRNLNNSFFCRYSIAIDMDCRNNKRNGCCPLGFANVT